VLLANPSDAYRAVSDTIPDVHFAVFRFDRSTSAFIGVYEFSQPFRKSLPPPGYRREGNIHWYQKPAADFGYTDVESRLTGERILHATTVWQGTGYFAFPPDSIMSTTLQHGFANPEPDTMIGPWIFGPGVYPDTAWAWVGDTDVIHRLASYGVGYELYAWGHWYRDMYYSTAEDFVLVATRPPGPDDMAILDVKWPGALATIGHSVEPEVEVHNFGDSPVDVVVRAAMDGPAGYVYESTYEIESLPDDSSRVVLLDPAMVYGTGDLVFDFGFQNPDVSPWSDAYPDNDAGQQVVRVTGQPIFRLDLTVPRNGAPMDFDGDGDVDVTVLGESLELWQNDGTGHFTDITAGSSLGNRTDPYYAACEDFNGDTFPDIFVSYSGPSPQLLFGDGTGVFTDVTESSGLDSVTTCYRFLAIDKENDNDVDVIIISSGPETVHENNGAGAFTDVTATTGITSPGSTNSIGSGDLNGDGFADIVMTHWQQGATVFVNDGDGTFTKLDGDWGVNHGTDAALFDYDGDTDEDLLLVQYHYSPPLLYRNNGGLTFEEVTGQVNGVREAHEVNVGDFNEDGWLDLVFSDGSLLMNRSGAFTDSSSLIIDLSVQKYALSYNVQFADLTNDGELDIYGSKGCYVNQGVSVTVGGIGEESLPRPSSRLDQSYPNPFNAVTTIRYSIAKRGSVKLRIYNVAGQLVSTLVDEVQAPKPEGHIVTWDARNGTGEGVATGVYFCRLETPTGSHTRKIVLLK